MNFLSPKSGACLFLSSAKFYRGHVSFKGLKARTMRTTEEASPVMCQTMQVQGNGISRVSEMSFADIVVGVLPSREQKSNRMDGANDYPTRKTGICALSVAE